MLRKVINPSSNNYHASEGFSGGLMKDAALCLLSSFLLILSFPDFDLWFFAWVGFIPLFFALKNKSPRQAFFLSYFTGVVFWAGIIYWLAHVTILGLIALVLYLGLYFGSFGMMLVWFKQRFKNAGFFLIPVLWVILEHVRSYAFSGFGWAVLGYSQYLNLPIIQIADITGVLGVSFVVMTGNLLVYMFMESAINFKRGGKVFWGRLIKKAAFPFFCIVFVFVYGESKLSQTASDYTRYPLKVSVVQGNIPQELKWRESSEDFIINKYISLSHEAALLNPHIIVWPEAAFPAILDKDSAYAIIADIALSIGKQLLVGAVILDDYDYYNSALFFSKDGEFLQRYDKIHLVPFGEYIPFRHNFSFLETIVPIGDFMKGKEYTVFSVKEGNSEATKNFAVLICFEDIFPLLSRRFVQTGADFLINVTNDAWFKKSSSARQHLSASVFRAVENRVFLIRCANTGISGSVSPSGEILSLVKGKDGNEIFVNGYCADDVILGDKRGSFYTRYGDVFVLFCGICMAVALFLTFKHKKGGLKTRPE